MSTFGKSSMDSVDPVDMTGGSSDGSGDSSAPVTRAEFEALKAQVQQIQTKVDDDDEEDNEQDDDSSDDSVGSLSSSIAGAPKSTKPSPLAKKMVGMNPLKSKPGMRPPFS